MLGYAVIVLAIVLTLRYLVTGELMPQQHEGWDLWGYALAISLLVGSWLASSHNRMGSMVKQIGGWIAFICLLIVVYGYRHELGSVKDRFFTTLMPGQTISQSSNRSLTISQSKDGHFHTVLTINNQRIPFLVDTGASTIVLSPGAASRVGFDPDQLDYTRRFRTANGVVYNAPVVLKKLELGGIRMQNVPAVVNGTAMRRSLLGMTFFNRLKRYSVHNERLTLEW
uniref:Peptidase A2 domain-containing protein n=1 Tax=Magnetococcus massalia (strain MO-1) TaxID=451514 RepID=A0A1S7LFA5_MAGMO|nr:conserved membrane protein of unknown function [Candidatus Magnetococcus massalia]